MKRLIILTISMLFFVLGCKKDPPKDERLPANTMILVDVYSTHKHLFLKVENLTASKTLFDLRSTPLIDTTKKITITGCYFMTNNRDQYRISYEVLDTNKAAYLKQPLSTQMKITGAGKVLFDEMGKVTPRGGDSYSSGEFIVN